MSATLPADNHVVSDVGHTLAHNNLVDCLTAITGAQPGGTVSASQTISTLLPLSALGDLLVENATPAPARLPGSTSTRRKILGQTGTGVISALPVWGEPSTAWINAVDNGADPTGSADSTAAVTAAIAAVSAFALDIYFPSGTYKFNSSSAIALATANMGIVGDGPSSILQIGASFSAAELVNITASGCRVRDVAITGANTTITSNPVCNGVEITAAQHCRVENVFFQYINGWCIESVGGASVANFDCAYTGIIGRNIAAGIHLKGVTGTSFGGEQFATNIQLQQVGVTTTASANLDGFRVEDCHDTVVGNINIGLVAGTGSAFHILGASTGVYVTNHDLGGGTGAIKIEDVTGNGSPTDIRFTNGNAQQSTAGAGLIGSGAGSDWHFTNVYFHGNQTDGCTLTNTGALANVMTGCHWNTNNQAGGTGYDVNLTSATSKWSVAGGVFSTQVGSGAAKVTNPVNDPNAIGYFNGVMFLGSGTTATNIFAAGPGSYLGCIVGTAVVPAVLTLQAQTPAAGVALINGTQNFVSWTAPADGNEHRVLLFGFQNVGSTETGGTVIATMTDPNGTARTPQIFAASQGAGLKSIGFPSLLIQSGSTITIQQSTALTGGSATVWLELWAA